MLFVLENAGHRLEVEHIDLPSALAHAFADWWPARKGGAFGRTLCPNLTIDGVPLMEALAAHEAKAEAA